MSEQSREDRLQRVVNAVFVLLMSTPEDIAQQFGQNCPDDHARINYALELLESHVTGREIPAVPRDPGRPR
jgi:hypothetical protein